MTEKEKKPDLTSAVCTTETLKDLKRLKRAYETKTDESMTMYEFLAMIVKATKQAWSD